MHGTWSETCEKNDRVAYSDLERVLCCGRGHVHRPFTFQASATVFKKWKRPPSKVAEAMESKLGYLGPLAEVPFPLR